MSATDEAAEAKNDTPTAPLAELKARYPSVREPILVALHILRQDPNVALEDAKVEAKALGIRITAASVAAAQRLLPRMDAVPTAPAEPVAATGPKPAARRSRSAEPDQETEELIRAVVGKVRAQGDAQADKLRSTIRRAIDLLTTALT